MLSGVLSARRSRTDVRNKESPRTTEQFLVLDTWNGILEVAMNGQHRENVRAGAQVDVILKKDQGSRKLTRGVVKDILTNSPFHPHGIKVRLVSGEVGRVQEVFDAIDKAP